ncbi:hypothetical protein [Corynebacterium guangdongense]|uniref:Prolipoprotein LppL n=1 Tax=Corynebacterium guangdongense TaxID=1783348 RepID=A0ABU1ZWP9_9CORY|nr:hypothetical protein [Corynebacterium guangdongense]MDR7329354.1 hypothetical protein [Corynebacterium guangdongense]WJZ17919.1 hypothetical protein CGUA_06745 [Corynebacterium guangdongense]
MYSRIRRAVTGSIVASALVLTACQQGSSPDPAPEMGNATPAASPESENPAGEVIAVGQPITDLVAVGDVLAYRTEGALTIGTVDQLRNDEATTVEIDPSCGDLNEGSADFVLACGDTVRIIPADSPADERVRQLEDPATTAALADNMLVVANGEASNVTIYREDADPKTIRVEDATDQLITVPRADGTESVVRTNRETTIIQNIELDKNRQGGTLRVGLGVGQIAPGADGLVIAADTMGPQIAVYGYEAAIRLQQTAPTEASPWGAAWDPARELAWVTSTAENEAIGYRIADGVPVETQRFPTLADAQNIRATTDGSVVVASATGEGLQIVSPAE